MSRTGNLNKRQTGFTAGRRTEDNVFILSYSIGKSKIERVELIAMAVNFEKTGNSVERNCVIEALFNYK